MQATSERAALLDQLQSQRKRIRVVCRMRVPPGVHASADCCTALQPKGSTAVLLTSNESLGSAARQTYDFDCVLGPDQAGRSAIAPFLTGIA